MAKRLVAAAGAVIFGAGVIVGMDRVAVADPAAAQALPGTGPCSADAKPEHEALVPKTLEVPVVYPVVTVDPGAPVENLKRVKMELPADPCVNPCPDLTDQPAAPPDLAQQLGLPRRIVRPQPFNFALPNPNPPALPPGPDPAHPPVEAAAQTSARTAPRVSDVREVAKLTGANSVNRTDKRWQVQGTDLGIMWESGPDEIAIAFGDTVGRDFHPPGGMGEDWRSNLLAFSKNRDLANGVVFDHMVTDDRCHATELLSSRKMDNIEITTIPTSGFAIGERQYMSYMSIRTWNSIPGTWYTNYGGIAYSDDHGEHWIKDPYAKWENIFGVSNCQVAAMVPQGDWVYMFGIPNTRLGGVGLARVPRDQVLNPTAYQYWQTDAWVPAINGLVTATPVVDAPAAELSVRYDASRKLWQMSYLDTAKAALVVRESDSPQGAWSDSAVTVSALQFPELYGGFIHPCSTGDDMYFTMSTWSDYNVYLMHATVN
ncbi:DUF4185 domain-containing protein [Nocardia seriolae]|uniref:DUF4185 domain-containing protein n=1 Tax=Nocardia seriolae TaxID=37332 RepID=A0A0B8NAH5_9NOCA|nr:DUF4185 domain-containing protein [Nocardia seriolae]MTJ66695.1 DUF4185 domain-containing protein [Nocardia seriolae]MTJ72083.1 DUF4185 domain-containing protein [Nocardia seriolae]MTJ85466.1 DUF4185 domain-containing protein [Nocardia seriolae]MTK29464.1 DUF4185 domain-containing protein [Nocardia seriolae]MTK44627.1 DUF4185 domain-containing protein [Nocardia seriolae]